MDDDRTRTSADVAIIGGGAAGTLAAIHLLAGRSPPTRVLMVERRPRVAEGVAYSTNFPEHLLNVVAARMSAFDDDPGHFLRFLAQSSGVAGDDAQALLGGTFARRLDFARYLRATLQAQPGYGGLTCLHDEALDIDVVDGYRVRLRSGRCIDAPRVVLATGNVAKAIPLPPSAMTGTPPVVGSWDYGALRAVDPDHGVCIVGAGLSMVDAVMSLIENGHRGPVTVISRHGLMPLAHADAQVAPPEAGADELSALDLRARLRVLRHRAAQAQAAGAPWQGVVDALRPHTSSLWQSLGTDGQRRFLRHAVRFWDIHRHRIAPGVAQRLEDMHRSGQLTVKAGRLARIDAMADGRVRVGYRPKGRLGREDVDVDCVVNAVGMETNIERMHDPLIVQLRARGLIAPGPHGMGIATDGHGRVLTTRGVAMPGMMTLGVARIGQLWESIAIPELRGQAQRIAGLVHAPH